MCGVIRNKNDNTHCMHATLKMSLCLCRYAHFLMKQSYYHSGQCSNLPSMSSLTKITDLHELRLNILVLWTTWLTARKVLVGTVLTVVCMGMGQVENAEVRKSKYGNGSMETEVQKPKCGSEKKSCLLMSSALLTHVKALQSKDDSIPVI